MAEGISSLSDAQLLSMAQNLSSLITPLPATYGLDAGYAAGLAAAVTDFDLKLSTHVGAQLAAKTATANKTDSRAVLEQFIRDGRTSAKAAKIPDGDYLAMGIPSASSPAPSNATVPAVAVDTSERLRHTLNWTDAATLDNKKKPRGAMGAEIWVKIDGPPPGNENDCVFLTLDAFTPYMKEYTPAEAGKTAHYMVRWRMRDGSVSAWGETVSATITG